MSQPTHDTESLLGLGLVFSKSASGQAWEDAPDGKGIYVSAIAQAETEDLQHETLLYKGSKVAFLDWPGKVSDLHGGPDAGDRTAITFDDEQKQIIVKSRITTPASVARVKSGELKGYSVEGRRVPGKSTLEKSTGKRITEAWRMVKLALVPDPALPISELTICKSAAVLSEVTLGEPTTTPEPDSFGDKLNKALGVKPKEPTEEPVAEVVEDPEVYKAKYAKADRDKMAASGEAMKDGSYPIKDGKDLQSAIKLRGNGDQPDKKIDAHIKRRAKALKLTDQIPDTMKSVGAIVKHGPYGSAEDDVVFAVDILRQMKYYRASEAAEDDEDSPGSLAKIDACITGWKEIIGDEAAELAAEDDEVIVCPACGQEIEEEDNFCGACGGAAADNTAEKSRFPRLRIGMGRLLKGLSGQLAEIKKNAGVTPGAFVQEDGVALATALVGVFERSEDRIAKSSKDFQADISAKVEKISGVVDFISKQPFPAGPLAKEPTADDIVKQASGSTESLAALAAEVLFREAATAPNAEMRRYLTARAERRQLKEDTK
jgi:hypothetical protein